MSPTLSTRHRSKTPPPGETGQEALYLRSLSDRQVIVAIKLRDGETVRGWIEYFDDTMLRLTREGQPNLFIYKQQIRTITEVGRMRAQRPESANREKSIEAGLIETTERATRERASVASSPVSARVAS
jgi:host factor-I protein